jgi:hypothetical protein
MLYLRGALPELLLPADPGIILFLFLSSASATAYIILSWSMAALASSLYDRLANYTRRSCWWMVSYKVQVGLLLIRVELPHVVEYTVVPLLKVQELLQLGAEQTHR